MPIPDYPTDRDLDLDPCGTWPLSVHRFDRDTAAALRAAEAAGRPLLLRGVPGTGKSQTARAAAAATGRLFVPGVIDGRSEAADLQWHYDAVGRLSDAHAPGAQARDAAHYLSPGPLWWAFDWAGAHRQWDLRRQGEAPVLPPGWTPGLGAVLLIDEIDKADPDLPNAFLEVLGNQGFSLPFLGQGVVRGPVAPLVVITTNEERELPPAFLRRCLVHILKAPADLPDMGRRHLARRRLTGYPRVLQEAARLLDGDRARAREQQSYAPGLAEYLDLVIAVATLATSEDGQWALLEQTAGFVLDKAAPLPD
ncbi:AAA family ATPase [uncultured Thiodictyon sp.]|jgi:MoxR-like ATPase|uniref:AAA family ATPase n=1 Tax=uncultured Thiodictyon sp. TaxID=1846217 RepID=UPI0025E16A8B|nr:AAA family ATPase [uncultured Thiodictyon sp.]